MAITDLTDFLWYWDAVGGLQPQVGGNPTFARASSGFVVPDRSHRIRSVPADYPRFPWVTVDGERLPALVLEHADTFHCLDNDDPGDGGNWTRVSLTATVDDAVAPDGRKIAHKLDDTGASSGYFDQNITIPDDSNAHCCYAFVRKQPAVTQNCLIRLDYTGGSTTLIGGRFGLYLADGTTAQNHGVSLDAFGSIDLGDYWLAWLVLSNNGTGNVTARIRIDPAGNNGVVADTAYDAAATGHVHAFGCSFLKDRTYPTSYPGEVVGSAVTRAADSMQWTGAPDPQAMVGYLDVVLVSPLAGASGERFLHIGGDTAGADPRFFVSNSAANRVTVQIDNGTASVSRSLDLTSPAIGDRVEIAWYMEASAELNLFVRHNDGSAASLLNSGAPSGGMPTAWSKPKIWLNSVASSIVNAAKYRRLTIVKPDNLEAALDGTEDDDLLDELAELTVNQFGQVRA